MDKGDFNIEDTYCATCGTKCEVDNLVPVYSSTTGKIDYLRATVKCPNYRWFDMLLLYGHTGTHRDFRRHRRPPKAPPSPPPKPKK